VIRFLADENLKRPIVLGLRRKTIDCARSQENLGAGASDAEVLAWAAADGRVLLSHDYRTMIDFALERVARGLEMPGLIMIPEHVEIGFAVDELERLATTLPKAT
jgi:predicted nuclease of predicted toxin-antitoxin system